MGEIRTKDEPKNAQLQKVRFINIDCLLRKPPLQWFSACGFLRA